MRPGDLRRHRRPGPQEADARRLRPGQPRAAAAGLRARRLRPPRLGGPGLRADRPRRGARARPHRVPRGRLAAAVPRASASSPGDFADDEAFDHARRDGRSTSTATAARSGNHAFYLSIPPKFFPTSSQQLKRTGLSVSRGRRLAPRRHREAVRPRPRRAPSELNDVVGEVFPPGSVFRIDHYLGKETVQNLLALRFANTMFEPIWNSNYVDHVQITMAEDIGIGGRAGYYDGIGAARDVIQNHLLQLLALTAMEEPVSFAADDVRAEKEKVLSAVTLPKDLDAAHRARPVRRRLAGRRAGDRLPRGGRHLARRRRPRPTPRSRLEVDTRRWAGRAVLPAHRQAARPPGHRDRGRLQARAAPAVQRHRHRGARPERARRSASSPTRASRCASARRCPAPRWRCATSPWTSRTATPSPSPAPRPTSGSSSTCCSATRRCSRGTRRSSSAGRSSTRSSSTGPRAGSPSSTSPARWGPASADEMLARDGRSWRRP